MVAARYSFGFFLSFCIAFHESLLHFSESVFVVVFWWLVDPLITIEMFVARFHVVISLEAFRFFVFVFAAFYIITGVGVVVGLSLLDLLFSVVLFGVLSLRGPFLFGLYWWSKVR